ncbi:MAG: response regulator transcription factor [Thermaceae bacterium]|nr:response regulator transcription factor [Thermaceae bacterium]
MRVLLVEDEEDLARALLALLAQERYQAEWADSVEQAYARLAEAEPDLLVLDVMLPEGEDAGFKLAQDLRHSGYQKPILFLTARDTLEDRVQGLDLGGDDYLTKPFEVPEFMARVRALLRREGQTKQSALERGPLRLDFAARRVFWGEQEAVLTEKEFTLLEVLALSPEKVFTVNELLDRVFPEAGSGHHALRMYVSRVREKLAPEAIVTVPGGYRLGLS